MPKSTSFFVWLVPVIYKKILYAWSNFKICSGELVQPDWKFFDAATTRSQSRKKVFCIVIFLLFLHVGVEGKILHLHKTTYKLLFHLLWRDLFSICNTQNYCRLFFVLSSNYNGRSRELFSRESDVQKWQNIGNFYFS